MSYQPVGWGRTKLVYDAALLAGIAAYIVGYIAIGPRFQTVTLPLDDWTLAIKAYGSCAFILLSLILCIGPLARLDRRFLPLLYNRRHFGVLTCSVAATHAAYVLGWYFAASALPPAEAALAADTSFAQLHGFAFVPFGIVALAILLALAATSHDFWLAFLGPALWKGLHMAIYLAYAAIVLHVALGVLQDARNPLFAMLVAASVTVVCGLHIAAAWRERRRDAGFAPAAAEPGWIDALGIDALAEGCGTVVHVADGEPVAVFRNAGRLSAVSNLCAHQNGPLGEGRVVDGCITCPWHGFQYRLEDGRSPPPFDQRIATYRLKLAGGRVLLDPRPNPPGTRVEPVALAAPAA